MRENFPRQLRQWPIIQSFDFDAYELGGSHFVTILKDKLSGITAGPGVLAPFPFKAHPPLPVSSQNVAEWTAYLYGTFKLRQEDVAMILPIHDSGKSDPKADFELFSAEERGLWHEQLRFAIARQGTLVRESIQVPPPQQPTHVTYNVYGTNSRVNINASDSSVNTFNELPAELFEQALSAVKASGAESGAVEALVAALEDLQRAQGTKTLGQRYTNLMSVLADHMQVMGPVIAPYLPALARLASG